MKGQLVISLDFEKFWGVFDSLNGSGYQENLLNVDTVVDRLLDLSSRYDIKLTFATVGFLFNKNKQELQNNTPSKLPTYEKTLHNPYPLIDSLNDDNTAQNLHFANTTLQKIKAQPQHEIGTHTYCHYYCLEKGQTPDQFDADLKMAKQVAKNNGITIKSIVFPRNQVDIEYVNVCDQNGIIAYRGHENHGIYEPKPKKDTQKPMDRLRRILDAYWNFTGHHIYDLDQLKTKNYIVNIPSSYFLRPFNQTLSVLEPFKLNRIKNGMTKAAKNNYLYHFWFHPHNFGKNMDANFKTLEAIFKTYQKLNADYGFESTTMSELAEKLKTS